MLGDNPEKSKNPLKIALRRRNAKTVQFTAPTYYEASDVEYSTDEDEEGDVESYAQDEDGVETQNRQQDVAADDTVAMEPLNTREPLADTQTVIDPRVDAPEPTTTAEKSQSIDDDLDRMGMHLTPEISNVDTDIAENDTSVKSRKDTIRNTDSFFKDDGVETRKINLTPSLLRDDSSSSTIRSIETREVLPSRIGKFRHLLMLDSHSKRDQASIHSRRPRLFRARVKKIKAVEKRRAC